MNRKEWREVGKQSFFFVLAMAGIVLLVFLADLLQDKPFDGEQVVILLGLWLLMFSMFMGLSPFAMDSKQKGMEYLLTLPVSRRRLLLIKLLPRLAVTVIFYLAFVLLYGLIGNDALGGGFAFFSLAYFSLFFISFSLSVVHENFVVQSIWAGIAMSGYLALCLYIVGLGFSWKFRMPGSWSVSRSWQDLAYDVPTLLAVIAVFLLLAAPFVASIFIAFKKFDLKPARAFNRRQLLIFMPLLLLAFFASLGLTYFVQTSSNYWESNLFILKNHKLLKSDFPGKLTLYEEAGRRSVDVKGRIVWERWLLEQGENLYVSGLDLEDGSRIIGCLNQADFSWKTLHRIPGRYFVPYGYIGIRYDGSHFVYFRSIANEINKPGAGSKPKDGYSVLNLVRVDPVNGEIKTLLFSTPLFKQYNEPRFMGSDERLGRRFWLVDLRRGNILRLWDDGHVEDLGVSREKPAYFGGLLFSHGDHSLWVRRLTAEGSEMIREIPGDFKLSVSFTSTRFSGQVGEIYAERDKRIVRVDLSNLIITDVGPLHGHIRMVSPRDFYYVEFETWPGRNPDKWKKLYRLQGGRMVLLKQFDFGADGYGNLEVSENGVVLWQHKIVDQNYSKIKKRLFAFPDLRELHFEGLD